MDKKFYPWRSYIAVMSSSENKFQRYNTLTAKLINLILALNAEQQRYLLKKVENYILKEKRTSTRKFCRIPVTYSNNGSIYSNFIINISRDGCFIEAQNPLLAGEKILLDIQLEGNDKSFKIKGEVANTNRIGMGIEFEEISNDLLKKIGNLIYKII
jgi:Tfp pilus assembly protein PilZ